MNKQHREGIGKMPPAPKSNIPNDFTQAVPKSGEQPSATGGGNLRLHNGKVCTETYKY